MEDQIYYGPLSPNSYVTGYHGVMWKSTKENCVVCKLSNGRHVGNGGYVRVPLRVMFMVLRAEGEHEEHIRDDQSPQHVLSNFVCPIIRKRRVKQAMLTFQNHHPPS
ncbi:hypothetical protein YC2023_056984 [Brassica napus]